MIYYVKSLDLLYDYISVLTSNSELFNQVIDISE